ASNVSNLDTNTATDVFARNLTAGVTQLVSVNSVGNGSGSNTSRSAVISANGARVAFVSYASNLTTNDTNGFADVFVRDLLNNTTQLVSINLAGTGSSNGYSDGPVISADGNRIAFTSGGTNLSALAPASGNNAYLRDVDSGVTQLVSINAPGIA